MSPPTRPCCLAARFSGGQHSVDCTLRQMESELSELLGATPAVTDMRTAMRTAMPHTDVFPARARTAPPSPAEVRDCPRWWFKDGLGNVTVLTCYAPARSHFAWIHGCSLGGVALADQPVTRLPPGRWLPCPVPAAFHEG